MKTSIETKINAKMRYTLSLAKADSARKAIVLTLDRYRSSAIMLSFNHAVNVTDIVNKCNALNEHCIKALIASHAATDAHTIALLDYLYD